MTSRGVFYVDGDEQGLYRDISLPENWTLHVSEHRGLSAALQWVFANYPDEANYGWLADDMAPRTQGWDVALEQAAGRCCMSQAQDLWVAPKFPDAVCRAELTAGQCWGGDLIRAVGWWALPDTFQAGTDVAWIRIVAQLGRLRYLPEVTVEHRHWRTGRRAQDALDTDMLDYHGHPHTKRDLDVLYLWLASPAFGHAVQRAQQCG